LFFKTIDFSKYSSIKIGHLVDVLMVQEGDSIPKDRLIIGQANNLLMSPTPPPLMALSKEFSFLKLEGDILRVGCATPTGKIVSFAKKHNIAGFEFLSKLPGSLGGVVAMNAGVKGYEIFNILESVKVDNRWRAKEDITYGYRFADFKGVATEVKFKIKWGFDTNLLNELLQLRSNQPKLPSAGSAFKNPKGDYAGRLIEAVGLKGFRSGDMQWSEVHANFLVNLGGGKFQDAKYLLDLAKEQVYREFKIELVEEIKIV